MKKVCINDFTPAELQVWMREFYPNGLNRYDLEKSSNQAKIKSANRKIEMFKKNGIFDFSDSERAEFKHEIAKLNRLVNKFQEAESDFVIARSWFKKSVLENRIPEDKLTGRLLIALNNINFEVEVLGSEY